MQTTLSASTPAEQQQQDLQVTCSDQSSTHLEAQQQEQGLHAVEAAIHEVAHEQVVGLGAVPAYLEQLHQVIELPMDVAACRQDHGCRVSLPRQDQLESPLGWQCLQAQQRLQAEPPP